MRKFYPLNLPRGGQNLRSERGVKAMRLEFFSTSLLKAIISSNIKQQTQKRKPFPSGVTENFGNTLRKLIA